MELDEALELQGPDGLRPGIPLSPPRNGRAPETAGEEPVRGAEPLCVRCVAARLAVLAVLVLAAAALVYLQRQSVKKEKEAET